MSNYRQLSETARQRVMDKIKRTMAMADQSASPEEAAIATRQVQALMRKHQIENVDVILETLRQDKGAVTDDLLHEDYRPRRAFASWEQYLWTAVCKAFQVECAWTRQGETCNLRIYGYAPDIEVAKYVIHYLVSKFHRLAEAAWMEERDNATFNGRKLPTARNFKTSWGLGAFHAVRKEIERVTQFENQETEGTTAGTSLVVAKRSAIEEKYGNFNYSKGQQQKNLDVHAYRRGIEDGGSIKIHKGVTEQGNGKAAQPKLT